MTMAAPNRAKIPTDSPQLRRGAAGRSALRTTVPTRSPQPDRGRPGRAKKGGGSARPKVLATGTGRDSTRGGDEVIELECGVTVYPARSEGGRWRAVWYEAGARQQCEAGAEAKLAASWKKIVERLQAVAPNMRRPGADLIAHYLDPDRLPVRDRWSRKHADPQRRLSGSPPPSSPRSPARTSRPSTPRRSLTPPRPQGRRPAAPDALRACLGRDRCRVPHQPSPGEGPLAGRGPPPARSGRQHRG